MNGIRVGQFILRIKSNLWWISPIKTEYKYPDEKCQFFQNIKKFFHDISIFSELKHITCGYCGAKGLDYQSEKHGWIYEGYHFWKCPDCLKGVKND